MTYINGPISAEAPLDTPTTPDPRELYAALRRRRDAYAAYGRRTLDISQPYRAGDPEVQALVEAVQAAEQAVRDALAAIEEQL